MYYVLFRVSYGHLYFLLVYFYKEYTFLYYYVRVYIFPNPNNLERYNYTNTLNVHCLYDKNWYLDNMISCERDRGPKITKKDRLVKVHYLSHDRKLLRHVVDFGPLPMVLAL